MADPIKTQSQILRKLEIARLNSMQEQAVQAVAAYPYVVILSPTGTGKTLAFLLPSLAEIRNNTELTQVLIVVPSRELAIQISAVIREMGTGYKTSLVYGGRPFGKEKSDLLHPPTLLIGTPGRIAAHFRRETIDPSNIHVLILDEFDKSLEIGFEEEMKEIKSYLPQVEKLILTSATKKIAIPDFISDKSPVEINFLQESIPALTLKIIKSPKSDKLDTLVDLLCSLGNQSGIIFCNFKDSIRLVSEHLEDNAIPHGCFYGGLEQKDREQTLIKFRNGTHRIIIATDLAARGIDIDHLNYIIHYELPPKEDEFVHRNGRTARMHEQGTAYILQGARESLPDFIRDKNPQEILPHTFGDSPLPPAPTWKTIYISGGRQDKISKGDIAGIFFKKGGLMKDELGIIELKKDCAYVAVSSIKAADIIQQLNNVRIKKKKVRLRMV